MQMVREAAFRRKRDVLLIPPQVMTQLQRNALHALTELLKHPHGSFLLMQCDDFVVESDLFFFGCKNTKYNLYETKPQ